MSPVPEKYSAKYLDVSVPLQCEMCLTGNDIGESLQPMREQDTVES